MAASKLVRISSGATQQEVLLSDVTTIGRQPTNTLQIVDRLVSKEHAIISRRAGSIGFQITDLESRNGTYVNDRLVEASQDLSDGDVVRIGSTIWRFESPPMLAVEPDTMQEIAGVEDAAPIHATMQIDLAHDFARADLVFDEKMLRADYEKLRLAYSLSGDLHAAKDIEELLSRLLNRVFEWLPVDRGGPRCGHPAPAAGDRAGQAGCDAVGRRGRTEGAALDSQARRVTARSCPEHRRPP
jgi:adenylate cyclase